MPHLLCHLRTESGAIVTDVTIPPFRMHPKVLLWGQRVFVLDRVSPLDPMSGSYIEAFTYAVLPGTSSGVFGSTQS